VKIRQKPSRRRGLTSVAVLVLLFVIALIATELVRLGVAYRDRTRSQERAVQADLLADAGVDRALARLSTEPDYRGESWEIPADSLGTTPGDGPAALVTIRVESDPNGGARTVRVQADYPPDPPRRARSSREVMLPDTP
jgi:Tfp pilus assembly protein PilX